MRKAFESGLRAVPLGVLRALTPRACVSLVYHLASDARLPWVAPLYPYKTRAQLEADLVWLRTHLRPVSGDEQVAHRLEGAPLPPRAVEVTFDDGFAECFDVVRPLLLAHGIPATFFVVTGTLDGHALCHRNRVALCLDRLAEGASDDALEKLGSVAGQVLASPEEARRWLWTLEYEDGAAIDAACAALEVDEERLLRERRPHLTREQVVALHGDGFTIGSHTVHHPRLGRAARWEDVRREVLDSCREIQALTGAERVPFAIPFNGLDLPRERLAELRREVPAISLIYDTNDLMRDRDFVVNRVWVDSPEGAAPGRSNLPRLLGRAHALEPARRARRALAGMRAGGGR